MSLILFRDLGFCNFDGLSSSPPPPPSSFQTATESLDSENDRLNFSLGSNQIYSMSFGFLFFFVSFKKISLTDYDDFAFPSLGFLCNF